MISLTYRLNVKAAAVAISRGLLLILLLSSCHENSCLLEPTVCYTAHPGDLRPLPSAFPPLTGEERATFWGIELTIGTALARDLDLWRAITSFKRAAILLPQEERSRRLQIEYSMIQAYALGHKYQEAIETFETSGLTQVSSTFPALRELLITLYDCYRQLGQCERATQIWQLLEKGDGQAAADLALMAAVQQGEIGRISSLALHRKECAAFTDFACWYQRCALSPKTAQGLNALLPGAGYLYVGQRKTALTSFLLNSLFIATTAYLIREDNWPAALLTGSLEFGWYFGGINGAGLAAKEFNQWHYNCYAEQLLTQKKLFIPLMWHTAF